MIGIRLPQAARRAKVSFATPSPSTVQALGRGYRVRLALLFLLVAGTFSLVGFRLVQLQVLENPELSALAARQYQRIGKIAPYRRPLLDRNGEELAVSVPSSSVFARPRLIASKRKTARALARVLGGSVEGWLDRLDTSRPFVWIQRQIEPEKAAKLSRLKLPGVFLEPENRRIYPNGSLAAHVIGFTDIDGNGLSGLERTLDRELLEKESRVPLPRDGKGNLSYLDKQYTGAGQAAVGLEITLDRRLQAMVEEEIDLALQQTDASAAIAIVLEPYTGEVLALAQAPRFDPNRARQTPAFQLANRALTHLYEPGSVLKPIWMAEAFERGLLNPESPIDCGHGKLRIGKDTIREAEASHRFGVLSVANVLKVSSNIGSARIAEKLGSAGLQSALSRFGLLTKTGIDLPGEASGFLKSASYWKVPLHVATAGFGQGLAFTPLQVVAAFAPFANGGFAIRPTLLPQERGSGFSVRGQRVLSDKTAETMRRLLVMVTEGKDATGLAAAIQGVAVAGKTGTAQKYTAGEGYRAGKYFSSFIGFLPAGRPELLIGVMIDEPRNGYYGGKVAAPVFRRIAERGLQILGKVPGKPTPPAPARVAKASKELRRFALESVSSDRWRLPDLKGASVRQALEGVGRTLKNVKIHGSGYLVSQFPQAGEIVGPESEVTLRFEPLGSG